MLQGSGFRVQGSGVQGSEFLVRVRVFRVQDSDIRSSGFRFPGSGVQASGFRIQESRVQDSVFESSASSVWGATERPCDVLGSGAVFQDKRGVRRGDQGGVCLEEKDGVRLVETVECHLLERSSFTIAFTDLSVYCVTVYFQRSLCEHLSF